MSLLYEWSFDEASGNVLDSSGNSRDFALTGNSFRSTGTDAHTNKGLSQSASEIQNGPSLTGLQTSNRTVMCWVKNTLSITGHVLEHYVTSLDSSAWSILFLSGSYHIQARNSSGFARASFARPTDNLWHHVAGTYDGTNVKLYIDAVLKATAALSSPLRTDANTFRVLDNSTSSTWIDDARGFDTALTQTEIQTYMNTPVGGAAHTKVYFQSGAEASGVYEMTGSGLVQRNSIIIK
jgi:hypothetical protein